MMRLTVALLVVCTCAGESAARRVIRASDLAEGDLVRVQTGPLSGIYRNVAASRDTLRVADRRDGAEFSFARVDVAGGQI